MNNLSNKIAIITGGSRGLGRAASIRLAHEGCKVFLADVNEAALSEAESHLKNTGATVATFCGDLGDHAKAIDMIEACSQALGLPDILVNNAGILRDSQVAKMTEADFDAVIRVNLKGVFNCGQAFIKKNISQNRGGTIVNVSSIANRGNFGQTNYAAAKAAVVAMTATWAMELARKGFRANAIAPGIMDTDMVKNIPGEIMQKLTSHIPLGRIGKPEEFAALVAFLAGDDSSYITGQTLILDGGATLGI